MLADNSAVNASARIFPSPPRYSVDTPCSEAIASSCLRMSSAFFARYSSIDMFNCAARIRSCTD